MLIYYIYFLMIMFYSGLFNFIYKYTHFLLMLLSLEMVVLSLYLLMFFYFIQFFGENFMLMFFLTMSVCESVLGLALLVMMIRVFSSDMIMLVDNLW